MFSRICLRKVIERIIHSFNKYFLSIPTILRVLAGMEKWGTGYSVDFILWNIM